MGQKELGNYLRECRQARGLTQEQLGRQINVGNATISTWERGDNVPSLENAARLYKTIGAEPRVMLELYLDGVASEAAASPPGKRQQRTPQQIADAFDGFNDADWEDFRSRLSPDAIFRFFGRHRRDKIEPHSEG